MDFKAKTTKEFFELCYRQYEFEMKETNQIYQKVSIVLVFLSILGTLIYNLGRIDIFTQLFSRVDVFLYYLFIMISLLLLGVSVFFAVLFILPRKKKYMTITSMKLWQKWRNDYALYQKQTGSESEEMGIAFFQEITDKLVEAQANNAPLNEERRQHFYRCVLIASIAVIPVSLQALFYFLIKLQGV